VPVGGSWKIAAYELKLNSVENVRGPNYFSTMGIIAVSKDGQLLTVLRPEKRNYPVAQMPTTEAAIDYRLSRDLYVVLGDQQSDNSWTIRTYLKPFTNWIWGGCALMAVGGLLSLTDRRLRIAAGRRKVSVVEQAT
jgi:cytochrome c-type biogenesis protein CcmF